MLPRPWMMVAPWPPAWRGARCVEAGPSHNGKPSRDLASPFQRFFFLSVWVRAALPGPSQALPGSEVPPFLDDALSQRHPLLFGSC